MEAAGAEDGRAKDVQLHARYSTLPPGTKFSLWKAASELPLHRLQERLAVGHLQPRTSRCRFRVITTSQRDGTLPLINSDVLCPTNEQQRQHSNTVALQKSRGKSRSVTTAPVAMALPAQTEPSNSIVTTSPHGPSNNAPASKVPGHDVSSHLPTPPSRLGNISLHRWSTMYSNRCYDRDRKTETAVSEVTTGGKMSAVNNKLENKGVDKQQELLLLRSCCRSYPNRLAKITHRKARRFTADSASHHYHVTDHVTGHMTGMYSDVTPPPSPPYVGLGMSVRKYACTI